MRVLREIKEASKDIKLLWASVFLRLFAYGITNQVLTLFLNSIDLTEDKIGWFMSLTLFGDVLCSYVLTWYADSWGRRKVLIYGSLMMMLSGIVFSYSENFHVLLLFAIIGVISPSSNEVGPFKSIEEAMIAHLTPHNKRPEIYSIHGLVGVVGSAFGAITGGAFVHFLLSSRIASTNLQAYKYVFMLYSVLAFSKVIIMLSLSKNTELSGHLHEELSSPDALVSDEMAPLIERFEHPKETSGSLSKETKSVLFKLLVIFMIDSLGSGFMTDSWMVYYYAKQFLMDHLSLGILFFITQFAMASTTLPSASISRAFGPVIAIVLVQIPSGIFAILIPFCEKYFSLSIIFLLLHFATLAMDVTPRQILLTNIIRPQDLTRVMGIVNVGKTFSRCVGPIFTGLLAKQGNLWVCYLVSGALVIIADFILAFWFLGINEKVLQQLQ